MHSTRFSPTLLAAIHLAACGGSDRPSASLSATRDTVGDTIVVRTLAGSLWGASKALEPAVSIGVLEGGDAYMFGGIAGIGVDDEQRIYVLDAQIPAVRQFAPDGSHIRDIGRAGEGPGEYEEPDGGPAVLPDGRVIVRDPGTGKLVLFSGEGDPIGDWRLPYGGTFSTSEGLYWDSAGNVLTPTILNLDAPVTEWERGFVRFGPDGSDETFAAPAIAFEPWVVSGQNENSTSSSRIPYAPQAQTVYSPLGRFVLALSTDYRIDQHLPDGTVLRIERDWEPVPVSAAEAADQRRRLERSFRERFEGWSWNGPEIPRTKPPFRDILIGDDGRLWVVVSTPSQEVMSAAEAAEEERATGREPGRFGSSIAFDVFEPDGDYLGRVDAPQGFQVSPRPVFRGETVWAVTTDELGVQRVVRFEARRSP